MDVHTKGAGALCGVAAAQIPIIFLGTGEQILNLEEFEPTLFMGRLLGLGDLRGKMKLGQASKMTMNDRICGCPISRSRFPLRNMYNQLQKIMKIDPLDQAMYTKYLFSNVPELQGDERSAKIQIYITIMDSMTDFELDNEKLLNPSRLKRIAQGSGRPIEEVHELLLQFKHFQRISENKRTNTLDHG
eukprot:Phypoly_transcript_18628.p1 GENE.Phypoly_transcript_18628~~Phypoly_transcript_18628.p1  ORF type:complete len:188 (+),score=24.47 Phypoly_transcript_18628:50-613(+)